MDDIGRKHGNILISTFRKIYGDDFAKGFSPTAKLSTALDDLDEGSRARLTEDAKADTLGAKIKDHIDL